MSERERRVGTVRLYQSGDAPLALVQLPGGWLNAHAARFLADRLSGGSVEVTARANLLVRGLPDAASFRDLLAPAGLLPPAEPERARDIVASPLPGRHPASVVYTDALVAALGAALRADHKFARLPPRFLFAVDDGSGLALGPTADVALVAERSGGFRLSFNGHATNLRVGAQRAPALAAEAARAFVLTAPASAARVADLRNGAATLARWTRLQLSDEQPAKPRILAPGLLTQRDGRTAITVAGRRGVFTGPQLRALAAFGDLRLGPGATVTVVDLVREAADEAQVALGAVGLSTGPP